MKKTLIVSLMLFATLACQNKETVTSNDAAPAPAVAQAQTPLTPEQLGELGAKIQKNPNDAEQLLTQHGLTQDSFQTAVRKVAENPDQSKQYAAGFKRAS